MSDNAQALWWVFILGVLASFILLAAVVASLVISQRRYLKLRRSQARRVLEAQEEERAWVSREVHDDAVQRLMLIGRACSDSKSAMAELAPREARRLGGMQADLEDLSVFLRGLAHRLHPALIDRGGLRAALRGLVEELERGYGLQVSLSLPDGEQPLGLAPQRELVLFRIAQEALHNVVKHAEVKSAELTLTRNGNQIQLMVKDEGRGFDPGRPGTGSGIGLLSINERVYLAEGQVEIVSALGEGTMVRASLPRADGGDP
jgi:signal transduction histidine kinase